MFSWCFMLFSWCGGSRVFLWRFMVFKGVVYGVSGGFWCLIGFWVFL